MEHKGNMNQKEKRFKIGGGWFLVLFWCLFPPNGNVLSAGKVCKPSMARGIR